MPSSNSVDTTTPLKFKPPTIGIELKFLYDLCSRKFISLSDINMSKVATARKSFDMRHYFKVGNHSNINILTGYGKILSSLSK